MKFLVLEVWTVSVDQVTIYQTLVAIQIMIWIHKFCKGLYIYCCDS